MKKVLLALACLTLMAGCGSDSEKPKVDWLAKEFSTAVEAARGTTLSIAIPCGAESADRWLDAWLAPELKSRFGIDLKRVPVDARAAVDAIVAEKSSDKAKGSIDLICINAPGFKALKQAGALFGPYAGKLPNFQAYANADLSGHDSGLPVEGFATPLGWSQFVFEHDTAKVKRPPQSLADLAAWIVRHPGRFTYPQPPDAVGSAFIRTAFAAVTGGAGQYMKGFDQALFERNAPVLWSWLNSLKPHLWKKGEAYPENAAALDGLFARGEVDFGMSNAPLHAQGLVLGGAYKPSVGTFVLDDGSFSSLHFVAIPFNAPEKAAALVAADFLMSPEAQLSKFDPKSWGDFPAIDVSRLPEVMQQSFARMDVGRATMSLGVLGVSAVKELPVEYREALDRGWVENVLRAK